MLKKLRIRFILINMTFVTLMMGVVFGMLYISTSSNLERESMQMMESIALNPLQMMLWNDASQNVRLPYIVVRINHAGETIETEGGFFDLSDEESLTREIQTVLENESDFGLLKEYNMRFRKIETPDGLCIVFADMTSEKATLKSLIRNFIIIASIAILFFVAISIFLAYWSVKPVEKAWEQQKQFVADASHELKTPLTVITTNAELLQDQKSSENERKRLSKNILAMSEQMRGLVENMLDLARIDTGTGKAEFRELIFSEIVTNAAMMFEPFFFEKGMDFSYHVAENIKVKGNERQLKQIVDVFLDNAGKYADVGARVELRLYRESGKNCILEVRNQGKEICQAELKNLFKRFYRADQVRAMNHSYGLGLSIARSITEEHGGHIWAESRDGYNCFYVKMPIR